MIPRDMWDMTGWHEMTCEQSETVLEVHRGLSSFQVESSLSDLGGTYGEPIVFTEWWYDDKPLMRDYRWPHKGRPCEHYGAVDETAAVGDSNE